MWSGREPESVVGTCRNPFDDIKLRSLVPLASLDGESLRGEVVVEKWKECCHWELWMSVDSYKVP